MKLLFTFRHLPLIVFAFCLNFTKSAHAQCNITTSSALCVGSPIEFNCNTVGASAFQWDFNAEGTNNSLCNPSFVFTTPGFKVIKLSLKLANGQTCQDQKTIRISAQPTANFKRISNRIQCFKNNQFCFVDSSFISGDSICNVDYVFDDGTKYSMKGNKVKQICHSFQDPAGGTYGVTVQITACNGCVKTFRYNSIAYVQASLGLQFTSPQPKRCDSVILTVTNNSLISLDSVQSYTWIWDDGTYTSGNQFNPSSWKTQVSHKYTIQGPNNGNFNVKLAVTGYINGCKDTFTFNAAATNLIIKPSIIASKDSVCASDSKITFKLKDSAIIGAANPLFQYEFPYIPTNITRAWTGSHEFTAPGVYKINFSFTHSIPGCGRTVYDTILVVGPQSIIESSSTNAINPALRYQCVITDTVKFTNFSKFYHNDNDFTDDDSVNLIYDSAIILKSNKQIQPKNTTFDPSIHEKIYGGFNKPLVHAFTNSAGAPVNVVKNANQQRGSENIERLWDFGDDYCERCSTDTKNNINVNKNCRYSKDLYPQHLYTDWDKIYKKYYANTYRWVNYYSKDSGAVIKRKLWADDTLAVLNTGDTLPKVMLQSGMTVVKYFKTPIASNDSISFASHRRHFYESKDVKCFTVKLYQKDMKHPLACASENTISLAMMPPSAKNLRKAGVQCLGNSSDAYGISFILDETKPGCHATWAEINFDTASNPNAWVPAIGKNLSSGSISMGGLPPVNPPFLISPFSNIPGNKFSKSYSIDDIKDKKDGFIDVGLIVGNGIHAGGIYPEMCQDTVYYPKFARFPLIDNSFRVISHKTFGFNNDYYKICKNQEIAIAPTSDNYSSRADIGTITYDITTTQTGKYHTDAHVLGVTETYKRFNRIHKDSSFLMDSLIVSKYQYWNTTKKITSVTRIAIARINQWHAEADVSAVYDEVKNQLALQGLNITAYSASQLADMIWNGKGIIGKAYTGSRGLIDTSGIGTKILISIIPDQKKILHFRDTSILPLETHLGYDNKVYRSYSFKPQHNGFYAVKMHITSLAPNVCDDNAFEIKKLLVGFYGQMNMADTILCHGDIVKCQPQFRYFEVYPEITFQHTDPFDYWRMRITEAGNVNREGYTRTDLDKGDDGTAPKSIFGGFPYSITGLDNLPGQYLQLAGGINSVYYNQDTGRTYFIRMAASDSTGCQDTFTQTLYTTAARAHFRLAVSRPQCDYLVELKDSSYVQDPHLKITGKSSDKIIKWTINWGDKSVSSTNIFFNQLPSNIAHAYTRPGFYKIKLKVETELGCVDIDSQDIYFPGPTVQFDTLIQRNYCKGDTVSIVNTSLYNVNDSSAWTWDFGDGAFGSQFDKLNSANNPIKHAYKTEGTFPITLYQYYKFKVGNQVRTCRIQYPDPNEKDPMFFVTINNCDSTSINDRYASSGIRMYPNPAHNTVNFVCDKPHELYIYNTLGQLIETIYIENNTVADLRHLSKGIYIIRTSTNLNVGKLIVD